MIETSLPRWSVRLDAHREHGFGDLLSIVNAHYRVHEAVERFLGPYNARQRSSSFPYEAPDKETLRQLIKRGGMNDFSYEAYLTSIIRFCEKTKGSRGLPAPHPSTIHSIQLPLPAFEIKSDSLDALISIIGAETPIRVKGLRNVTEPKFIIVRPKLSQLGTASASNWEVLFYREALGYIPDWADSSLNPRYSGKL
jgi:hypothetical protein